MKNDKTFQGEHRVTTPTATESVLPWKRMEDDKDDSETNKQTEFPSWANNKVCFATRSWSQILSEIYFPAGVLSLQLTKCYFLR